jgi:hypothetical protein
VAGSESGGVSTTPEYGWPLIEPTDFVTNLPADLETLADAIDETVKDLNPGTTAGDLDYYTSSTAKARLAIGTAGQMLAVNSGATAPEWITVPTPAGYAPLFTLINAGGTATTGAGTITVSGVGSYNTYLIILQDVGMSALGTMFLRLNGVSTGLKYNQGGILNRGASTYLAQNFGQQPYTGSNFIDLGATNTSTAQTMTAAITLTGGGAAGLQMYQVVSAFSPSGSNGHEQTVTMGLFDAAAAITSVSVTAGSGNLNAGTIFVYGAN